MNKMHSTDIFLDPLNNELQEIYFFHFKTTPVVRNENIFIFY